VGCGAIEWRHQARHRPSAPRTSAYARGQLRVGAAVEHCGDGARPTRLAVAGAKEAAHGCTRRRLVVAVLGGSWVVVVPFAGLLRVELVRPREAASTQGANGMDAVFANSPCGKRALAPPYLARWQPEARPVRPCYKRRTGGRRGQQERATREAALPASVSCEVEY
jgi:hypothetical protein